MKLSRKWLNEFVNIDVSDKEYADAMTMSGSKVETTEYLGAEIINVVAGNVISVEKHPQADKLFICLVDVGSGAPATIVTGAANVNAGDMVPVALDGSTLPGGKEIKSGTMRGVRSEGMLCSLDELGLTLHDFPYACEDGIFVLREDCRPGQDIRTVLGLDDSVIEFEITNNRPDCLSMIGLARESAATFGRELKLHAPCVKGSGGDIGEHLDIEIWDPDLCSRYTARMVKNVNIAPSPGWMRERLRAAGVRPISNIVDITNYVMLEYGQPMHAFDFSCVNGDKIIVRRAYEQEKMETLDGALRNLTTDMLVIADNDRAIGVAGVMGGLNSEITESTQYVVFESANFNGPSIRRTASALGMRTDASSRFEKGLDPLITLDAVNRACELVELLGAGEVIDGVIDVVGTDSDPVSLLLDAARINRLLGTSIDAETMRQTLRSLGFGADGDNISVPSWRRDVEGMADIAEEIARMYGYNKIPSTSFAGSTVAGGLSRKQTFERALGSLCRSLGYDEIMTYSFISPSYYDRLRMPEDDRRRESVALINPLGEETGIMRTTALPSMLDSLGRNYNYRNKAVRLYEIATVYEKNEDSLPNESQSLIMGAYGADMDFFSLKGALEVIAESLNIKEFIFRAAADNPSFHPGRCARIYLGGEYLGVIGQVHPLAASGFDIGVPVYALEISFDVLLRHCGNDREYAALPRYPAVTRDLAVVCGASVPAAELMETIRSQGGALLKSLELFDVYTGDQIESGMKSIAFSLKLSSDERTLTDSEADGIVSSMLDALKKAHGAVLR